MRSAAWILTLSIAALGCSSESRDDAPTTATAAATAADAGAPANFVVTPPPAEGSKEEQRDVDAMLEAQATRSQADCDFANSHFDYDFTAMYHGFLSDAEITKTAPFLGSIFDLTGTIVNDFKARFNRTYPFEKFPQIQPCVPTAHGVGSYPSGHSAGATTSACILAEIFPQKERAEAIRKYGERQGDLRVVMGRHYPTDVVAGKKLGQDICQILLRDPQIQRTIASLR